MDDENSAHGHGDRHEHHGMTSRGMFDDEKILEWIGLSQGQTFLDAGCADGHFSITASSIVGKDGHIFALDIHEPSLVSLRSEIEKKDIINITVKNVDIRTQIPIVNGSIDHFFLSNVMHGFVYNGEELKIIDNISKTLKDGGFLSLIEWDKNNVVHGPPREHRLSFDEMKELLSKRGFKPIKKGKASSEHIIMLFKKQ